MSNPTISSLVSMRIHKKIANDDYILYHPQTGDNDVLIGTARWEGTGFIPTALYQYTGASVTTSTASVSWVSLYKGTYPYVKLSEYLTYINDQIENFGGVLEFVGTNSIDTIVGLTPTEKDKGKVYIVQNTTTSPIHRIVWRPGSSGDWVEYPSNTLFVYVNTPKANYINYVYTSGSTTSYGTAVAGWVPLGGSNDIYAKKTEAIGSVTYTGSTFTFSYVSGGTASTITIPTIGTVAAGTSAITTSISSASSTKIPTEGAVYSFAASAGQVKVTAATQGYLIGVQTYSSTDSNTARAPLDFNIPVSNGDGTATLGANISGNADTATQVNHDFKLEGRPTSGATSLSTHSYNGSATISLRFGANSFLSSYNSTDERLTVNVLPTYGITVTSNGVGVQGSNGITVDSNGVSVKASTGIAVTSSGVGIKGAHTISAGAGIAISGDTTYQGTAKTTTISLAVSGVSTGVYSALQIDPYGRAIAGAQSLVFAPSLQSADLSALVVGGLAFIGADETGNNSSYSAPDGTVITSSNIS